MSVSIVIPLYNEAESIRKLLEEILAVKNTFPLKEVVVVDDGSDDNTSNVVLGFKEQFPEIRLFKHSQRSGQSSALRTGIIGATGNLIVTMDGDGQNDPKDIEILFKKYQAVFSQNPHTMVAGQRIKRNDDFIRRLSSRAANFIRSSLLADGVRDTGCSLKLFRRSDFLLLPFFVHIHRFLPALMKANGVQILLVDVSHRSREKGVSKYGFWDRLWVGIADLFGVRWLMSRTRKLIESVEL